MTEQEPITIRLFCKKGYEVHKTSMNKCLKCAYFGKPCITTIPPSFEVIERLKRIEGELRVKVPVEWLKSAVQANKESERGEDD